MTRLAIRSCPCGCGTSTLMAVSLYPRGLLATLEFEPVLTVAGGDPVHLCQRDWVHRAWLNVEVKREGNHG